MKKLLLKVKNNSEIADRIFRMDLEGQFDLQEFSPGKFLHVKCGNSLTPILRRPMSTLDVSDDGSTLSLLYRVDGAGTKVMSETKVGEDIDVLAPLGGSFPYEHLEAGKTVLLVGGGIGVPPLYYLARKLVERGINVKAVLGFSSKKDSFLEKEFKALGDTFITTIDGTHGHKGMVTDITYSEELGEDVMYCCGPTVMMKALKIKFQKRQKLICHWKNGWVVVLVHVLLVSVNLLLVMKLSIRRIILESVLKVLCIHCTQ